MIGLDAKVKLGKVLGIPIGLHWSWFIIFALVTASLSAGYFVQMIPDLPVWTYWFLGTVTSLLFFLSVLAHEYGHAILALKHNIPVHSITLLVFGGVAQIGEEPRTAREEFQIAIAGPLVSLACAVVFGLVWLLARPAPTGGFCLRVAGAGQPGPGSFQHDPWISARWRPGFPGHPLAGYAES